LAEGEQIETGKPVKNYYFTGFPVSIITKRLSSKRAFPESLPTKVTSIPPLGEVRRGL